MIDFYFWTTPNPFDYVKGDEQWCPNNSGGNSIDPNVIARKFTGETGG